MRTTGIVELGLGLVAVLRFELGLGLPIPKCGLKQDNRLEELVRVALLSTVHRQPFK